MSEVILDPVTGQPVETQTQQETQPTKIVIDGVGEFTPEEIKEFKNGYMRQQDYTRKTQELSEQRKQVQTQQTQTPVDVNKDLERKLERMYIDMQIKDMKQKYDDFDEVQVLSKAVDLIGSGMDVEKVDFDFIYKGLKEPTVKTVDEQALRQKIIQELSQTYDTSSLIGGKDIPPVDFSQRELAPEEERVRIKMGMTKEDWIKYS